VPDIRACLADLAPGGKWEPQRKGKQGYGFADHLEGTDGTAAVLWWGGTHAHPHVVLSGDQAHAGSELLRTAWPDSHQVSRVDACIDYADEGAYDRLQGAALEVAQEHGVRVDTRGDHLVTRKGRTVYLGAPTSHTRLRIYDKGEQLRQQYANDPVRLATVPDHLARFECQVRPATPTAREIASRADPITVMGASRWMRALMAIVAGIELEPYQAGKPWRQADDDRAYAALLAQYGGLLKRIQADLGHWDLVGRQLGYDLAERDEAKRRGL
jgi:hypothetical protein